MLSVSGCPGLLVCALFLGCGGNTNPQNPDSAPPVDAAACTPDNPPPQQPWTRAPGAPHLVPGQSTPDGTTYLVADPSALFDEAASAWKVWYSGARGACFSCPYAHVIEYAHSSDGRAWTTETTAALRAPATGWDSMALETPDVVIHPDASADRRYVMAYAGGEDTHLGFANYQLGVAFSADGRTFARISAAESPYGQAGLALIMTDAFPSHNVLDGVLADPTLLLRDGVLHVWMSSYGCSTAGCSGPGNVPVFGISHATSTDGIHWTPSSTNPVLEGAQQPTVLWNAASCHYEMWFRRDTTEEQNMIPADFNGLFGAWRATSPDGVSWTVDATRDFFWDGDQTGEELGLLTGVDVSQGNGETRLYYVGMTTTDVPSNDVFVPVHTWYDPAGFVNATFGLGYATR